MLKAKTRGSKNCDGGSKGNLNGKSAKETMLSEERVSGQDRLLSLVVDLYILVAIQNVSKVRA